MARDPSSPIALSPLDREIINTLQGGFPIASRPFDLAAAPLGCAPEELRQRLRILLDAGAISRFGPLFNAERMGGAVSLAAMKLPPEKLDAIAQKVNAFPEVAHNYAREHPFNLWFVLAVDHPAKLPAVASDIARETGFAVFLMPKEREFRLGFGVKILDSDHETRHAAAFQPMPPLPPIPATPPPLSDLDRKLVVAAQEGLPLTPTPYRDLGELCALPESEVLNRFQAMLELGAIRRIGVIPNHLRLGLAVNGMSVWDAPDHLADECGRAMAQLPFVSHCYQRPRHPPEWPFNLFAMLHGESREAVEGQAARLAERLGPRCRSYRILYTARLLKKSGLRLADGG